MEEAFPEAAALLQSAGWAPHPEWQVYTRDTRVAGITPDGTSLNVKNWALITPEDPRYGPDTPDTAEEAAAWLVAWHEARTAVLTTHVTLGSISLSGMSAEELAPPPEPAQTPVHEGDGDDHPIFAEAQNVNRLGATGEESEDDLWQLDPEYNFDTPEPQRNREIDADFTDDLGAEILDEHPEHASGAFIFGDNLDQKRTAAIGLVMQAALARMPAWSDTDTARLSELRNFAMGVSEGRWNDDPGSRQWLEELETRLRRRSQIVSHRDGLVEHLNSASREEIEAFDPEAGWPE